MSVEKYNCAIQKILFAQTSQDSTLPYTRENSKIFNITSQYFSFFNKKPPASRVAHITRDFLICYSCSHYSAMAKLSCRHLKYSNTVNDRSCPLVAYLKAEILGWTLKEKNEFTFYLFFIYLFFLFIYFFIKTLFTIGK